MIIAQSNTSKFIPTRMTVSEKFGNKGMFTTSSLSNIPNEIADILINAANFSLASSTWSTYRSSINRLNDCSGETGIDMTLPLSESQVSLFVGYLLKENLSASTVESYLSGLRQAHIAAGLSCDTLKSDFIKQVLRGRKNQLISNPQSSNNSNRLPVTPSILALIKKDLKASDLPNERKLLIWAISTLAFFGGFRIHEILSQNTNKFDPLTTLLNEDVDIQSITIENSEHKVIQICLKTEKTNRTGRHNLIDVYPSNGALCPVRAFVKWDNIRSCREKHLPAFRDENGSPYTGRKFNVFLKRFMSSHFPDIKGQITSHSFRSGLATLLGTLGYSDEDIQTSGRWSSRCFEDYLKLPRSKRIHMAKQIANHNL